MGRITFYAVPPGSRASGREEYVVERNMPASEPAVKADHWPKTVGYFGGFVALGMVTAMLGPTLPGLAEQTNTRVEGISFLFMAHSVGYLIGSFFGGRLYDRVAGHPVMAGTMALMIVTLAVMPAIPVLWLLAAAWLLVGLSGGAIDVGGNTLLVWIHGSRVGPYMNAMHFFFGVGSFLAPLLVAQALIWSGGIRWTYWTLAVLLIPVAVWLARQPSPAAVHERAATPGGDPAILDTPRRQGITVVLIALLLALYVGAEVAFGGWIYSYALAQGLGSAASAAYLTSAFWGGLTFGRLLSLPVAARVRPRWIILVDLLGCILSLAVMLIWSGSVVALWVGSLGLGVSMASVFPTAITLAERRVRITGQVTAWLLVGASIGGMLLPWMIGQLFESVGPAVTMTAILADLVLALGVFGALMATSRRGA
jgi:FHS family Na+ dependent glucose MFS transporter 1